MSGPSFRHLVLGPLLSSGLIAYGFCQGEGESQMNKLKQSGKSLPWLAAALVAVGVIAWVTLTFPL